MLLYAALGAVVLYFCVTTSPQAVARLLLHLAVWLPYHCGRHVASFLAPSFFWKSVQGEVVVLTGGAGGIGKLIATKFAAAGATLVLIDKSAELLDEARKAVEAAARRAGSTAAVHAICVDLSNREATFTRRWHMPTLGYIVLVYRRRPTRRWRRPPRRRARAQSSSTTRAS